MKPIRLMAAFFTVGVWTMASRLLGFARDIMIAAYLGSGPVAEAFLVAFSLPNMFRRFFAEGAFNMAFIPMFSKKLETDADHKGFAQDAFSGLATVLIVFSLIAQAAMPWLVLAMASGFAGDERFDLAVVFGRIAFGAAKFARVGIAREDALGIAPSDHVESITGHDGEVPALVVVTRRRAGREGDHLLDQLARHRLIEEAANAAAAGDDLVVSLFAIAAQCTISHRVLPCD